MVREDFLEEVRCAPDLEDVGRQKGERTFTPSPFATCDCSEHSSAKQDNLRNYKIAEGRKREINPWLLYFHLTGENPLA